MVLYFYWMEFSLFCHAELYGHCFRFINTNLFYFFPKNDLAIFDIMQCLCLASIRSEKLILSFLSEGVNCEFTISQCSYVRVTEMVVFSEYFGKNEFCFVFPINKKIFFEEEEEVLVLLLLGFCSYIISNLYMFYEYAPLCFAF